MTASLQCRGSPHRQAGGEANLLSAAQKLFLAEGFPKHWEFWPQAVYFLYFLHISLVVQRNSGTIRTLPFIYQSPADPHQDLLPRDTCPETPQGQRGCTSSLHQAVPRASREMLVEDRLPLPIPDAHPRAILAGGTTSHCSQMLLAQGR